MLSRGRILHMEIEPGDEFLFGEQMRQGQALGIRLDILMLLFCQLVRLSIRREFAL